MGEVDRADVGTMVQQVLDEVGTVFAAFPSQTADRLCDEVVQAGRIACYGVGREGLMMRALCMRLMHLGLDAHVVGDMTTPPLGPGDLLLTSAGPGSFSTVLALMGVAHEAGARTVVITAQPQGAAAQLADGVIHLPARTMADDLASQPSLLPMGSLFEIAQLVLFDVVSVLVRDRTLQAPESMHGRHTNLE